VTVNDLRTNISILEKSTEVNFCRCEKDEKIGSSRKIQGKKGKAPMDDLDGKALESNGIIRESPIIHLIDKKQALEMGVIMSVIPRQTSDMEGERGTRL